jgi:hypothetical protein
MPKHARQPHPAALIFSEQTRRRVADGSLFDHCEAFPGLKLGSSPCLNADNRCVIGALMATEWPEHFQGGSYAHPDVVFAADAIEWWCAGLPPGKRQWLGKMAAKNDRGDYADRAKLRRDLLGEEA